MDSRQLITGSEEIDILVDSDSIERRLDSSNSESKKILHYQQHESISFLRTPTTTTADILSSIEEYCIEEEPDQLGDSLTWPGHWSAFLYTDDNLERRQRNLAALGIQLSLEELRMVGVRATLNSGIRDGKIGLFLTANDNILSNRRAIESEFGDMHGINLNIFSPSETGEFIGLSMRHKEDFIYYPEYDSTPSYGFGLTNWCWSLRDLRIPHIGGDDEYITALRNRVENLILGLDEIGYQYYKGTGNHTNIKTRYHFDHLISLYTGILDSVALHIRDKFEIDLPDKDVSIRTGEPLFRQVREENEHLWAHIEKNHRFVELIYVIRPLIIHREGVMSSGPGFEYREGDGYRSWESHMIDLSKLDGKYRENFSKYYRFLDDELLQFDPLTKWGLFTDADELNQEELAETVQILEPYQFVKKSADELLRFVDGCMELLGYENRLDMLSEEYETRFAELKSVEQFMLSPLL